MTARDLLRPALALAALSTALLAGCSGKEAPATAAAPPGQEAQAAAPPPEFVPEDPAQVRREADLAEARGRFRSLREAFAHGGRASPASRARLLAAVRGLPVPPETSWDVACRGRACRVKARLPAPAWQPFLENDPEVRRVADRVGVDPDGEDRAAYVLVAAEGAADGDDLLGAVEKELSGSAEAKACAANAGGPVAYELRVDASGITYRTAGNVPREVADCVDDVLGGILRTTTVPPSARSASRTVALRP